MYTKGNMPGEKEYFVKYYHSKDGQFEIVLSENMNMFFEPHNHVGHVIISIVLSGSAVVWIDGKETKYREGEVYTILPFQMHSVRQDKDAAILSLCVNTAQLERTDTQLSCQKIQEALKELCEIGLLDSFSADQLMLSLHRVYASYENQNMEWKEDMKSVVDHLIREEEPVSLEQLAKDIHISKFHLIREFKREIGMTPHQFHIQNRIRKAQSKLQKDENIAAVAVGMGFYDQSHFNKSFKKIVGISPKEYLDSKL